MLLIYKELSKSELEEQAKECAAKAEEFFAAHPKRKECSAAVWYGKTITIRRGHVKEDVAAALEKVCKK